MMTTTSKKNYNNKEFNSNQNDIKKQLKLV